MERWWQSLVVWRTAEAVRNLWEGLVNKVLPLSWEVLSPKSLWKFQRWWHMFVITAPERLRRQTPGINGQPSYFVSPRPARDPVSKTWWGWPPTSTCMHACEWTHTHTHTQTWNRKMQVRDHVCFLVCVKVLGSIYLLQNKKIKTKTKSKLTRTWYYWHFCDTNSFCITSTLHPPTLHNSLKNWSVKVQPVKALCEWGFRLWVETEQVVAFSYWCLQ